MSVAKTLVLGSGTIGTWVFAIAFDLPSMARIALQSPISCVWAFTKGFLQLVHRHARPSFLPACLVTFPARGYFRAGSRLSLGDSGVGVTDR